MSLFVEQNERLLDQRTGEFGGGAKKDGERGNYRGGDRDRNGGGERGGYRGGRGGYRGGQARSYGNQNQNASAAAASSRQ